MARDDNKVIWPYLERRQAADPNFALPVRFVGDLNGEAPATLRVEEGEPVVHLSDAARAVFSALDSLAVASRIEDEEDSERWLAEFARLRTASALTPNQACRFLYGPHFQAQRTTYRFNAYESFRADPAHLAGLFSVNEPWPLLDRLADRLREDAAPSAPTDSSAELFTWPPFYEELATKLLPYRQRQGELIAFLESLRERGCTVTPLEDEDASGNPFLLKEIDPFTFFATFNRGLTDENRLKIIDAMRVFFTVAAPAPKDFAGIPIVNNQSSWFISHAAKRGANDVALLWDVFELALGADPIGDPAFGAAFDAALSVRGIKINLTMALFWIRPRTLLSIDGTMREHLHITLPKGGLTFAFYQATYERVLAEHPGQDFVALSHQAYLALQKNGPHPGSEGIEAIINGAAKFWFVGAYWDSNEASDQTDRFLAEGVWENGWPDRYLDRVREMKVGDRICIKATSTQKNGLPYDNRGQTASRMEIKARGTVVGNDGDGRSVAVEWEPKLKPRFWYGYTYQRAVWLLRKESPDARRLIRFAFFDEPQDFRHVYIPPQSGSTPPPQDDADAEQVDAVAAYAPIDVQTEGAFLSLDEIELALRRLRSKKLLVLQGAPGVGKTYVARKLAYALMETKDDTRIEMLQFHPAYTYEDFMRGYRPTGEAGKFELKDGPFALLCERAKKDGRKHVLIIDEINRGHLSQVFGELFMLLEADKRGPAHGITPLYRRDDAEKFYVPDNVYVIATMNIADRSLALVDFALRRRFAFMTLEPSFGTDSFRTWLLDRKMPETLYRLLTDKMLQLNARITKDAQLGSAFRVGHSFFCPNERDFSKLGRAWYDEIVATEIAPLIDEYWYDKPDEARAAKDDLRS